MNKIIVRSTLFLVFQNFSLIKQGSMITKNFFICTELWLHFTDLKENKNLKSCY